jgi:TonB-dependent starch-binding outer membrane protein SusC
MKKTQTIGDFDSHAVKKALLIMKLSFLLVFVATLQVSANVNGQEKVSLKVSQVEIARVLNSIERQGTYRFLYNSRLKDIQKKISVNAEHTDIPELLTRIFEGTDLTYKLLDNNLIAVFSSTLAVQDITVTGKVTGEFGEALSGVSVTIRGSSRGTTTDNNGLYTLTVPPDATLIISYIGYSDQEIVIKDQSIVNIKLLPSNKALDQVVVVGYGTQKKIDVTGATATIKGSELVKQPVLTATQAMQGKAAGVQIISSGQPGTQPSVRIRGTGSMLGGADPLYVVDGVLTTDITNINTADIVNVDVLKDASSTAIYGARGANGVIIITTKQGATGKMQISYNGNVGVQMAAHLVKMANAQQYIDYVQASLGPPVPSTGYSTDWYKQILRNAIEQDHNISISGASEKNKYLLSFGYADDEGIVINNDFKRFTVRLNDEFKLANNLTLGTLASYTDGINQNVNLAIAYNDAYRAAPTIPGKINGKYGNTSLFQDVGNPILDINDNNDRVTDDRLQGNVYLEYKPIPWLTLRSSIGADWEDYYNRLYNYQFFADSTTFITPGGNQSNQNSSLALTTINTLHWVWDNTVTFNKHFGAHGLTVLVGTTAESVKGTSTTSTIDGVPPNPNLWNAGNGNQALPFSIAGSAEQQTRNSYIARVNYSYADRYLLTANFRADGSSTFPVNNRWGYFPSVGVGWIISKEDFMKSQRWFDVLKIRGSWGEAGNDVTGTGTQGYTLTLLQNLPYYFGGSPTSGSAISQIVDQNLKWETSTETDAAIEFSSLASRLTGEVSYYNKTVKNALIYVQIPSTLGSYNPTNGGQGFVLTNAASVQNKGVELTLNWHDHISKDFSYSIGGNVTFNNNNVTGLNGGQPYIDGPIGADQPYVTKTASGHPIGSYYVQKVLGVFQSQAEINSYTDKNGNLLQPTAEPGDFKYQYNSNGQLDSVYAGSYQPKAYYGINIGVNYKQFDISVGGYGSEGGKIYNGKKAFRQSLTDNVEASTAEKRWTNSNHSESEPVANGGNLPASTYFVETGSYFRINNINLGYTLKPSILQRTRVISSLRIYLSAQNPFTITKYSGFTPELQPPVVTSARVLGAPVTTGTPTNAGIELNAYPTVRTFSAGVNVAF